MKADSSIFPGKSLKKDINEHNLFVQNSNSSIVIFTRIMQKGYKQKIEIDDVGFDQIYEFIPIGHDRVLVVGAKGELSLIKYLGDFCSNENCRCSNNKPCGRESKVKCGINCGVQELDFTNLFVSNGEVFEEMEISSITVSEDFQIAVVASHCHSTGMKKRLYMVELKNSESLKLLEIKKYEGDLKQRSAYMAMNMSYNVHNFPLLICYEHCPSGNLVSYTLENFKFKPYKVIENFSTGYIFTCEIFEGMIWTIDSEGEINSLVIDDEGEFLAQKKRRNNGKKSHLSSVQEVSAEQNRDSVSERDPWKSIQETREFDEIGFEDDNHSITVKNGVKIPKIQLLANGQHNEILETNSDLNINHNDSFVHLDIQSFYSKESNTRQVKERNISSAKFNDSSNVKFNVVKEDINTTERKGDVREPETLSKNLSQDFEEKAICQTQKTQNFNYKENNIGIQNTEKRRNSTSKNKQEIDNIIKMEDKINFKKKIEFYTFDDTRITNDERQFFQDEIERSLAQNQKRKSTKATACNSHENSAPNSKDIDTKTESDSDVIHENSYDTTLKNFESFSKHGMETERSKDSVEIPVGDIRSVKNIEKKSSPFTRKLPEKRQRKEESCYNSGSQKQQDSVISEHNYYYGITETSCSGNTNQIKPKSFEIKENNNNRILHERNINLNIMTPSSTNYDINKENTKKEEKEENRLKEEVYESEIIPIAPENSQRKALNIHENSNFSNNYELLFNRKNLQNSNNFDLDNRQSSHYRESGIYLNNSNFNERESSIDKNYLENQRNSDEERENDVDLEKYSYKEKIFDKDNQDEFYYQKENSEILGQKMSFKENLGKSDTKIKIEDLTKSMKKIPQMSAVLSKTVFSTENEGERSERSREMFISQQQDSNNKQVIIQTGTHFGKLIIKFIKIFL